MPYKYPVSVTYRVALQEVIQLLEAVAAADPRVLTRPTPQGLFISYGEISLLASNYAPGRTRSMILREFGAT